MNTYLLTDITWNTDEEYDEEGLLPEKVVVTTSQKWSADLYDAIVESLAEEFGWDANSFHHESVSLDDEDCEDAFELELAD